MGRLSESDFLSIIKLTCLFALDLILMDDDGRVLVARRNDSPAKGFFFVPGGRVRKNESLDNALQRILMVETGTDVSQIKEMHFRGLYDHFYEENRFDDLSFNTHYVIAAIVLTVPNLSHIVNIIGHDCIKLLSVSELLQDAGVHEYVKSYFVKSPKNCFIEFDASTGKHEFANLFSKSVV